MSDPWDSAHAKQRRVDALARAQAHYDVARATIAPDKAILECLLGLLTVEIEREHNAWDAPCDCFKEMPVPSSPFDGLADSLQRRACGCVPGFKDPNPACPVHGSPKVDVDRIRQARADYEAALKNREHGGVAADRFVQAVCAALGDS
jgi:hypothetical protein